MLLDDWKLILSPAFGKSSVTSQMQANVRQKHQEIAKAMFHVDAFIKPEISGLGRYMTSNRHASW